MHAHRFRHAAVEAASTPAYIAPPMHAAVTAAAPASAVAELYRIAYEAALVRVVARRRCSAPFSRN